jgi:predicted TIM-barrel fold metal-dependent hydrolase
MDKGGIETAVTSVSTPGVWFGDVAQGRRLARACNEYAAQMAHDFPGRFGVFAVLPLPDLEGSLREIEYASDVLGADGFCLMTSYGDKWPGDPAFAAVFDELDRREAVVFFHPTVPACCVGLVPDIPPAATEFLFDTTRAIASLIFSGTTSRCSKMRYVFSHGGGTLPYIVDRVIGVPMKKPQVAAKVQGAPLSHVRKFSYDIATVTNPIAVTALRQLVGISQLLYGSDEPFSSAEAMAEGFRRLDLSPDEVDAIERGNALRLLPALAVGKQ